MKRPKEPTHTILVTEHLRQQDDFVKASQLVSAGCGNCWQVSAALWHLRQRNVVWVEIDPAGVSWWALMPPEADNRSRVCKERAPETKKRRLRLNKRKL